MNVESVVFRVLLTNIGLEGCDKHSKILARNISIEGMDVIYIGNYLTSVEIAQAAIQEDVDALVINLISCSEIINLTSIPNLLMKANALDIKLLACGVINVKVAEYLKKHGISEVLLQNTPHDKIISRLQEILSHPKSR